MCVTAGLLGLEEVRDSPGLCRPSFERMGDESILDEPETTRHDADVHQPYAFRFKPQRVCELTEDTVSLEGAGLRQVGHEVDAVSSLPAVIATQIWIANMNRVR